MPELPEVQTIVTTLAAKVAGCTIAGVDIVRADYVHPAGEDVAAHLVGRVISAVGRRGKRIIFTLDNGEHFLIQLGMTGRLTVEAAGLVRLSHTHVVLTLRGAGATAIELHLRDPRRFGGMVWLGAAAGDVGLGLEPLTMRPGELRQMLSRSRRPIKSFLLDQTQLAGLGNIYADEALFKAGIYPLTPANAIAEEVTRKLCRAIKQVLRLAILHRGSTLRDYVDAEGGKGGFQHLHNVYNRAEKPCRVCGAKIRRVVLSGRSTCFCPHCQKSRLKAE